MWRSIPSLEKCCLCEPETERWRQLREGGEVCVVVRDSEGGERGGGVSVLKRVRERQESGCEHTAADWYRYISV